MSDQNVVNNLESLKLEKERLKQKIEFSRKMIASNMQYEQVKSSAFAFLPSAMSNFVIPKVSGLVFGKKNPGMHLIFSSILPVVINSVVQLFNNKSKR